MHTKALYRAAEAMNEVGISVLRFNFRGVGVSTGSFDEGIGEQEDAKVAVRFLQEVEAGVPLLMGGFSFGAMVALAVGMDEPGVVGLVALGIPLDHYDFTFLERSRKPVLLVQGDDDEFGSGERVGQEIAPLNPMITLRRIPGCPHYFLGHTDELMAVIRAYFRREVGSSLLAPSLTGD
jgi:alpha/beta superfamily hydrolase